jgi:hypothetical protein
LSPSSPWHLWILEYYFRNNISRLLSLISPWYLWIWKCYTGMIFRNFWALFNRDIYGLLNAISGLSVEFF